MFSSCILFNRQNDDHLVFPENAVQKDMIKMQERLARERLKLMAKQISASSTWNIQVRK